MQPLLPPPLTPPPPTPTPTPRRTVEGERAQRIPLTTLVRFPLSSSFRYRFCLTTCFCNNCSNKSSVTSSISSLNWSLVLFLAVYSTVSFRVIIIQADILFHSHPSLAGPLRHGGDRRASDPPGVRLEEGDPRQGVFQVWRQGRRRLLRALREEVQAVPGHCAGKCEMQPLFALLLLFCFANATCAECLV